MSTESNNPSKLAFSSRCVPGSAAEQEENARLAEFQRCKSLRKAEEERNRPQLEARRNEQYLAATEANRERIMRDKAARSARGGFPAR